jgi:hypothetical protein
MWWSGFGDFRNGDSRFEGGGGVVVCYDTTKQKIVIFCCRMTATGSPPGAGVPTLHPWSLSTLHAPRSTLHAPPDSVERGAWNRLGS